MCNPEPRVLKSETDFWLLTTSIQSTKQNKEFVLQHCRVWGKPVARVGHFWVGRYATKVDTLLLELKYGEGKLWGMACSVSQIARYD